MKTFKEFLAEATAKITKTEQAIIDMFLTKDEITISKTAGSGSVRGGGGKKGDAQFNAAKKLLDKGVVSLSSKSKDSYINSLTLTLNPAYKHLPTAGFTYETFWLLNLMAKRIESDTAHKLLPKLNKKEQTALYKLEELGIYNGGVIDKKLIKKYGIDASSFSDVLSADMELIKKHIL